MSTDSLVSDCLAALARRVSGDLRTDSYSRMLYSTDASIYQVQPYAVLIPGTREDVHAAVETAVEFGVPILPRASGSSLAGQTVGEAIVIDFTRHLDRILEIDPVERRARVEPGVILGALNDHIRPLGLQFGPDPASANRAAIGGVVSNNATGAHSILYGMTADHVHEMNVILSDGSRARLGPVSVGEVLDRAGVDDHEARVYDGIHRLCSDPTNLATIRDGTPRHWRRCGGYNLDRFAGDGVAFRIPSDDRFNLSRLVCGAEGTLAVIEDVTLDLVSIPTATSLAIIHFDNLHAALSAVPVVLETGPSAVELLDNLGMSLCRQVPAWRRKLEGFIRGEPNCVLITEFYGESELELRSKMDFLECRIVEARCGAGEITRLLDAGRQADVWSVRKMGLGFLMSLKGDHKPIPFIEDAAVPPAHLADYVTGIERFCHDLGTDVAYYAHASAGCVHIRPLINTKSAEEISRMPQITSFAIEQLRGIGGALSSEHGDGRARSQFNERFFGPDLYGLYRQVKRIFDPENLFNPGNIVDAGKMTENLRFGQDYNTTPLETKLDFTPEQGFARAIEMCNGAGVCRKLSDGVMCPSFMATRDEEHSTRGRANALRAVMSGRIDAAGLADNRLFETMDLCLQCKACASECPSSVDMSKLKVEFLAQYYREHGIPFRSRLFGSIAARNRRLSGRIAPIINALGRSRPLRWGLDKSLGITRHRPMPAFARQPFTEWFEKRDAALADPVQAADDRPRVILFNDTFNTYNYPGTSIAATMLLEAAGYSVELPGHQCCGRPWLSKGMVERARDAAHDTIVRLAPHAEEGIPIVGLEPSCLLPLRDEYDSLLPGDARVPLVASRSYMLEEFIDELSISGRLDLDFTDTPQSILLHGHCHQKAIAGTASSAAMLSIPPNYGVTEVSAGCCGLAGSFGYESEHFDVSMRIGEDRLLPAVREAPGDTIIAAAGVSCRQQIEHATGRLARHPAEILWEALKRPE